MTLNSRQSLEYENNDAVVNHIWDTLVQNESETVLVEADKEQESLSSLHKDWLSQREFTVRKERSINSEVTRIIQRRDLSDKLLESNTWATEPSEAPEVAYASDSESEKEDENEKVVDVPKLRKHNFSGKHRSHLLAGNTPQYAGFYCNMDNDKTLLDDDEVTNIVFRDNYFLSSIDPDAAGNSPATRYLNKDSYLSTSGLVEDVYPYAFSAKVQTYTSDNPTYKDIVQLPEEERKL